MASSTQIRAKAPELPGTGGVWFSVVLLALAALLFMVRGVVPDHARDGMGDSHEALFGFETTAKADSTAGE